MIERPKTITQQAIQLIRERIESGEYPPNSQLPSENKLAEELGISRSTIRSAMATLATRGLVERRHGFGTYVVPRIPDLITYLSESWEFSTRLESSGQKSRLVYLSISHGQASQEDADLLQISTGDEIIQYRSLIFADDVPIALNKNIVSANLVRSKGIDEADEESLKSLLTEYCLVDYAEITVSLKPALASQDSAEKLQIEPNDPIFIVEEIYLDHDQRPLVLCRNESAGPEFRLRIVNSSI